MCQLNIEYSPRLRFSYEKILLMTSVTTISSRFIAWTSSPKTSPNDIAQAKYRWVMFFVFCP